MRILIAVASRHGSTHDIAARLGEGLRQCGHTIDVRAASAVHNLAPYGAVVVGSAVYMGRWLPDALAFLDRLEAPLGDVPVWIFSSGPLSDPTSTDIPSIHEKLASALGVRGHRVFAGRLVPADLNLGERLVVRAVHAPSGDFRDWEAVTAFADEICAALRREPVAPGGEAALEIPRSMLEDHLL
jgi:menaquinone-dependent protoporphyrinogen oxidase